jgi:hypothetical protein
MARYFIDLLQKFREIYNKKNHIFLIVKNKYNIMQLYHIIFTTFQ